MCRLHCFCELVLCCAVFHVRLVFFLVPLLPLPVPVPKAVVDISFTRSFLMMCPGVRLDLRGFSPLDSLTVVVGD